MIIETSWLMLRGKQVLPEGLWHPHLCQLDMALGLLPCWLLPHSTGDFVPLCCGVGPSTRAAARGQLAKVKCVRVIPILQLTGCPTASVTWAQPVLGIWTCNRGHTNGASEAGWQNSFACGVSSAGRIQTSWGVICNSTCETYLGTCII